MHDTHEPHIALIKCIYIKGSLSIGLHLDTGPMSQLTAYSNTD